MICRELTRVPPWRTGRGRRERTAGSRSAAEMTEPASEHDRVEPATVVAQVN